MENTRVGSNTDYDKLTLEVLTNGTISARDAVSLGARILVDHFVLFTDLSETMGSRLMWALKPRCVLMEQDFIREFCGQGPVWTLE